MRRALMFAPPPPSRPTLYAAPVVHVTVIDACWSTFATSGPAVPKSSVVGAVVATLHAFWMMILTGIVLVTDAAERRLVDVRPNATSTAPKIALFLIFIVAIPPGMCGLWVPD